VTGPIPDPAARRAVLHPVALLCLLGSLSALGPFSIDMYLPAMPAMRAHFAATTGATQATLSAYFVGLALGQLMVGPVADRIGRRGPMLFGLSLYALASLGCMFAPTMEVLIAMRFLQAVGACAGMVVPRAILRDLYPPQNMARMLSMLLLVMGIAPIIAPMVGTAIHTHFGWQALFGVLCAYGVIVAVVVWRYLPETLAAPSPHATLRHTTQTYLRMLGHRRFMGYSLAGGIAQAGMFAYIASSSFVFLEAYGLTPAHYALLFGAVAIGLITASQVNSRLLRRIAAERLLRTALWVFLGASAALLAVTLTRFGGPWSAGAALLLAIGSLGFSFPNSIAAAMSPFGDRAGMAAALLGSLQFSFAGIASYVAGRSFDGTGVPMALVILACAISANLLLRVLVKAPQNAEAR